MLSDNRRWLFAIVFLSLAAGACVCGGVLAPVRSTAEDARNTAGTAQAVATEVGGAIATGQAVATDVGGVLATGQAVATTAADVGQTIATDIAPLGPTIEAGLEEVAPTLVAADLEEVRQWALSATATSQREAVDYSAAQAVGVPNTPTCGDAPSAWSSLEPNGRNEELTVVFAQPVIPTRVNIYESVNPGYVTQVRVVDVFGDTPIIYQSAPLPVSDCPRTFSIPVSTVTQPIAALVITIDQAIAPSWTQIDAVELVGLR